MYSIICLRVGFDLYAIEMSICKQKMEKDRKKTKQYCLTENDLQGLHEVLLELLVEFDRICRKNNIKYSIDGGTLLGAVRHGGFIPWDDDADVIMTRKEYEKFKRVYKKELNSKKFYFQSIESTLGYRWGYAKLRRKGTKCVRLNQEHMLYEQGIYLDIFVCDNVPENYLLRSIGNFKSYIYRKIFWSAVGQVEATGIKRRCFSIMAKIPEKFVKKSYFRYIERSNKKHSKWVKCLIYPACNRVYGYKREWYEDVEDIMFEGVMLKGSRKYKEYLKFLYGEYMILPPENKRKVHPVMEFKLPEK